MTGSRTGRQVCLDDVISNAIGINMIIADRVGDPWHSIILQDLALHIAVELHHGDQTGPIPSRVLTTFEHRPLSVGSVPIVIESATSIVLESAPDLILIVARKIQ